jgi:hypothetical protein
VTFSPAIFLSTASLFVGRLVAEVRRIEPVFVELLNELVRKIELERLELELAARLDLLERADLVGVVALVEDEPALVRADDDEVVLPALREAADGDLLAALERLGEQRVRAIAALVGPEEVRLLDVEEVDRVRRDELLKLDHPGAGGLHRLELLVRELHVLVARVLVAASGLGPIDDDVVDRAEELLLQLRFRSIRGLT